MNIRQDLLEIENELIRANLIAEKLKQYDDEWVHNKNNEDMNSIYKFESDQRFSLELIYSEGRQMARSFAHELKSHNNVEKHASIYSWVQKIEEWIKLREDYENIIFKAEEIQNKMALTLNSISQMIYTFKNQIKLLRDVEILLRIIKTKNIYLQEERAVDNTVSSKNISEKEHAVYDVFISHVSEDCQSIVEPLLVDIQKEKISPWYDKQQILWGDGLVRGINHGLAKSKFVIFIISNHFVNKSWPEAELEAILSIEASTGVVRVLPLLVGTEDEIGVIFNKYPLLASKKYLIYSSDNHHKIIEALKARLNHA